MKITLQPIGFVNQGRSEPIDDNWDAEISRIRLDGEQIGADAVLGLDQFSHIEVVYWFHHESAEAVHTGARRPRGNPDWPAVGILAQRAKNRPNRLGVTTCRLLKVDGLELTVSGLDAIEGSPILDIKPYMSGFAPRGEVREPAWAKALMQGYW
jgi:tRNA-Thr(GGU) m(6)t(6)A37 methyltransferase TsaA